MLPYATLYPPLRFALVEGGVCVGSYPTLRHFRFLRRHSITVVLSLTPEPPTADLVAWAELCNVTLLHVKIIRTAPLNLSLLNSFIRAINLLLEQDPSSIMYIHCLDGRRITNLFLLLLRRVQGYASDYIWQEYTRRQPLPATGAELDRVYKETEKWLQEATSSGADEIRIPQTLPKWLWEGDRYACNNTHCRYKYIPPLEQLSETTAAANTESIVMKADEEHFSKALDALDLASGSVNSGAKSPPI